MAGFASAKRAKASNGIAQGDHSLERQVRQLRHGHLLSRPPPADDSDGGRLANRTISKQMYELWAKVLSLALGSDWVVEVHEGNFVIADTIGRHLHVLDKMGPHMHLDQS